MKFKFLPIVFAAMALCTACSDSKTDEPDGGDGTTQGGTLSPEQTKVYIEETAQKAADMCNPDGQRQLIALSAHLAETYGDLEMPDIDIEGASHSKAINPGKMFGNVAKALREGNYSRAAAELNVFNYSFADFKGVYTPGRNSWVRSGNSENIVIRCQGLQGQVEMIVKPTGAEHTISFDIDEDDYDWWTGQYYEWTDRYNIKYPEQLTITLTEAGRELVNLRTAQMVSVEGHKFVAKVTGNIMNINIDTQNEGNDSRITSHTRVDIDGKLFAKVDATLNGRRLCDMDNYENIVDSADDSDDDDYYLADKLLALVSNASASVDALGDIQVKVSVPEGSKLRSVVLASFDADEESGSDYRQLAEKANDAFSAKFYVNGSGTAEGDVYFRAEKYTESYYGYSETYWELVPVFRFYSDGSVYAFDDYFSYNRFYSLTTIVEDVLDSYERVWNYYWH